MELRKLRDQEIEDGLEKLVHSEREILHKIILHIQEVHRRKIYLARGYSSLFAYLCEKLKYSSSSAQRRIEAARLAVQVPEVISHIQNGNLSLSSIGEIQRAVKAKEVSCTQKVSVYQKTELVLASLNQSIQRTQKTCAQILDLPCIHVETQRIQKDDSRLLYLTLTYEQHEKLEKVKGLLAPKLLRYKNTSIASVIEELCDLYLDKKLGKTVHTTAAAAVKPVARTLSVTPKVRKIILQRDQSCQWKDKKTGKTCNSNFNLQIDHKIPIWAGGRHEIANLRALCQEHNKYRYQTGQ